MNVPSLEAWEIYFRPLCLCKIKLDVRNLWFNKLSKQKRLLFLRNFQSRRFTFVVKSIDDQVETLTCYFCCHFFLALGCAQTKVSVFVDRPHELGTVCKVGFGFMLLPNRPSSCSEKNQNRTIFRYILQSFWMCTTVIEAVNPHDQTSPMKMYKNSARSRLFCRIAKRSFWE